MDTISFITSNPDKYREIKEIFNTQQIGLTWIKRSLPEIQASTLEEVAEYTLSTIELTNVFIEDAGFFIDTLGGFPGVYSRYVYDTVGNEGILKLLKMKENRKARFAAVIGYKEEGTRDIKLFKGEVEGYVSHTAKGYEGFGYDPIFIADGYEKTFGENVELKSMISHRKKAAEKLIDYLKRN